MIKYLLIVVSFIYSLVATANLKNHGPGVKNKPSNSSKSPILFKKFGVVVREKEVVGADEKDKFIKALKKNVLPKSSGYCARFVKDALVESGLCKERPLGNAKDMALRNHLKNQCGFIRCEDITNPLLARPGAVLIYEALDQSKLPEKNRVSDKNGAYGHIEVRTEDGFISDYFSKKPRSNSKPFVVIKNKLISVRVLAEVLVKPPVKCN